MRASEEQLHGWMVATLGGDEKAYRLLLISVLPLLRGFFRRRLGGDPGAEDLVQEVLIAVHARRMTWDPRRPFTAWLYAIARYRLIDHWRRAGRTVPVESVADTLVAEGFEDAAVARADVGRLLGLIPPKQAAAIRATRLDGLSTAEAAAGLAISEADVKVSVHRGLKALTARLEGRLKGKRP